MNNRKYDCDALTQVADELQSHISRSARNSTVSEEDSKYARLEAQKTQMSMDSNALSREVQVLVSKERELNEEVLRLDRVFEDKWKLLNEM